MANKLIDLALLSTYDELLKALIADTYATKATLAEELGKITSVRFEVVDTLPETGEDGVFYLVSNGSSESKNVYKEYIWAVKTAGYWYVMDEPSIHFATKEEADDYTANNNQRGCAYKDKEYEFELLGDTAIDLTPYIKTADADAKYVTAVTLTADGEVKAIINNVESSVGSIQSATNAQKGLMTADQVTALETATSDIGTLQTTVVTGAALSDEGALSVTINGASVASGSVKTASASANGLMSKEDKSKLDDWSVASVAEIKALFGIAD